MRVSGISAQFLRTNTMPARGPACPVGQARFTLVLRFARPGFFNCRTESPLAAIAPVFNARALARLTLYKLMQFADAALKLEGAAA
jgi:hypothetical protein